MTQGFNQRFMVNPRAFLEHNQVAFDDVLTDKITTNEKSIGTVTLYPDQEKNFLPPSGAGEDEPERHVLRLSAYCEDAGYQNGRPHAKSHPIQAYWLPNSSTDFPHLDLGDEANFFFCFPLQGPIAFQETGSVLRLLNVSSNIDTEGTRGKATQYFGNDIPVTLYPEFAENRFDFARTFIFGIRRESGWHLYSQFYTENTRRVGMRGQREQSGMERSEQTRQIWPEVRQAASQD